MIYKRHLWRIYMRQVKSSGELGSKLLYWKPPWQLLLQADILCKRVIFVCVRVCVFRLLGVCVLGCTRMCLNLDQSPQVKKMEKIRHKNRSTLKHSKSNERALIFIDLVWIVEKVLFFKKRELKIISIYHFHYWIL